MTDEEFRDWATYHINALRLPDGWQKTLVTFREPFDSASIESAEAVAASNAIRLREDCNPFDPSWQLRAILRYVHQTRSVNARKQMEQEAGGDQRGECELCRATGLVIVPHPRNVVDGMWLHPFATCVVACHCALGRWKVDRLQDHREQRVMSIVDYQGRNAQWHAQLRRKHQHDAAVSRAHFRLKGEKLLQTLTKGIGQRTAG